MPYKKCPQCKKSQRFTNPTQQSMCDSCTALNEFRATVREEGAVKATVTSAVRAAAVVAGLSDYQCKQACTTAAQAADDMFASREDFDANAITRFAIDKGQEVVDSFVGQAAAAAKPFTSPVEVAATGVAEVVVLIDASYSVYNQYLQQAMLDAFDNVVGNNRDAQIRVLFFGPESDTFHSFNYRLQYHAGRLDAFKAEVKDPFSTVAEARDALVLMLDRANDHLFAGSTCIVPAINAIKTRYAGQPPPAVVLLSDGLFSDQGRGNKFGNHTTQVQGMIDLAQVAKCLVVVIAANTIESSRPNGRPQRVKLAKDTIKNITMSLVTMAAIEMIEVTYYHANNDVRCRVKNGTETAIAEHRELPGANELFALEKEALMAATYGRYNTDVYDSLQAAREDIEVRRAELEDEISRCDAIKIPGRDYVSKAGSGGSTFGGIHFPAGPLAAETIATIAEHNTEADPLYASLGYLLKVIRSVGPIAPVIVKNMTHSQRLTVVFQALGGQLATDAQTILLASGINAKATAARAEACNEMTAVAEAAAAAAAASTRPVASTAAATAAASTASARPVRSYIYLPILRVPYLGAIEDNRNYIPGLTRTVVPFGEQPIHKYVAVEAGLSTEKMRQMLARVDTQVLAVLYWCMLKHAEPNSELHAFLLKELGTNKAIQAALVDFYVAELPTKGSATLGLRDRAQTLAMLALVPGIAAFLRAHPIAGPKRPHLVYLLGPLAEQMTRASGLAKAYLNSRPQVRPGTSGGCIQTKDLKPGTYLVRLDTWPGDERPEQNMAFLIKADEAERQRTVSELRAQFLEPRRLALAHNIALAKSRKLAEDEGEDPPAGAMKEVPPRGDDHVARATVLWPTAFDDESNPKFSVHRYWGIERDLRGALVGTISEDTTVEAFYANKRAVWNAYVAAMKKFDEALARGAVPTEDLNKVLEHAVAKYITNRSVTVDASFEQTMAVLQRNKSVTPFMARIVAAGVQKTHDEVALLKDALEMACKGSEDKYAPYYELDVGWHTTTISVINAWIKKHMPAPTLVYAATAHQAAAKAGKVPAAEYPAVAAAAEPEPKLNECCICLEVVLPDTVPQPVSCCGDERHNLHHECMKMYRRSASACPLCRQFTGDPFAA